jgi:thiol-disulfide isomerase/thioredoxin
MSKEIYLSRRRFLSGAATTLALAQFGMIASAKTRWNDRGPLSAFDGTSVWLNSKPMTAGELHGKVVLVDFWTYTCINWRRQLPYVRAWAEKYKDKGLVVIGVHAPEFSFEKNVDNVRWATKDMRIDYPVVIDNEHAIWRAFNNEYWPAL